MNSNVQQLNIHTKKKSLIILSQCIRSDKAKTLKMLTQLGISKTNMLDVLLSDAESWKKTKGISNEIDTMQTRCFLKITAKKDIQRIKNPVIIYFNTYILLRNTNYRTFDFIDV